MNRRSFLTAIGLSPIALAIPACAPLPAAASEPGIGALAASINNLAVRYGVTGQIDGVFGGFVMSGLYPGDLEPSVDVEMNPDPIYVEGLKTYPRLIVG